MSSPRRQAFIHEYPIDRNATQAAIRAGYSEKTAYSQGQRLLKDAEVSRAIDALIAEREQETKITAAWVVTQIREHLARCVAQGDNSNASRCLDMLAKHTGAYEVDNTQKRPVVNALVLPQEIARAQGIRYTTESAGAN